MRIFEETRRFSVAELVRVPGRKLRSFVSELRIFAKTRAFCLAEADQGFHDTATQLSNSSGWRRDKLVASPPRSGIRLSRLRRDRQSSTRASHGENRLPQTVAAFRLLTKSATVGWAPATKKSALGDAHPTARQPRLWLAFWLDQFADGQTNEGLIAGFTGSAEHYKEQTSPRPAARPPNCPPPPAGAGACGSASKPRLRCGHETPGKRRGPSPARSQRQQSFGRRIEASHRASTAHLARFEPYGGRRRRPGPCQEVSTAPAPACAT